MIDVIGAHFQRIPEPGEASQLEDLFVSPGGHAVNVSLNLVGLGRIQGKSTWSLLWVEILWVIYWRVNWNLRESEPIS